MAGGREMVERSGQVLDQLSSSYFAEAKTIILLLVISQL